MKIDWYKSANGIYVASSVFYGSERQKVFDVNRHRINGQTIMPTFHQSWYFVPGETEASSYEVFTTGSFINKRYILIDESLADRFQPVLWPAEVNDNDGEWTGKHATLQSLYRSEFDQEPSKWVTNPAEFKYCGEIEVELPGSISDMKIRIKNDGAWEKVKELDLSTVVNWYELEKMLIPDLLLHKRPCYITSAQSYKIVRQYVKENLDRMYAEVTSDYDFCFTVKKKIQIKPIVNTYEEKKPNGKSYARPRITNRTVTTKLVEIFEMTDNINKYKGYTPIEGFKGNSLEDLIENVRLYLNELMFHLNQPISECSCCNGTGHLVGKKDS
jgi:hypothetical protein